MGLFNLFKKQPEIDWSGDLLTVIREQTSFEILDTDSKMVDFINLKYQEEYGNCPFYPVITGCGGIVIDSWIRLYGAGELSFWYKNHDIEMLYSKKHPKEMELILGEDVIGGMYGYKNDMMYYFDPGTAAWRSLAKSYEDFIRWLVTSPDEIRAFYDKYRWSSWQEDVKSLTLKEGFSTAPAYYKDSDTPVDERFRMKSDMMSVIGVIYNKM